MEPGDGPSDERILAAIRGFEAQFDRWYLKVMREAVQAYRTLIIGRINPIVRRTQLDGLPPAETAERLVRDYDSRNYVTAGGWAVEQLAQRLGVGVHKSTTQGFDLERTVEGKDLKYLWVVKSGTVTRNSDILRAVRENAKRARTLARQANKDARLDVAIGIAAGRTSSTSGTDYDQPSSGEFWADMLQLPEDQAIDVVLEVAMEAGRRIRKDGERHVAALQLLVTDYIESRADPSQVDWEFLARRTMKKSTDWKNEDKERHTRAVLALLESDYAPYITDRMKKGVTSATKTTGAVNSVERRGRSKKADPGSSA